MGATQSTNHPHVLTTPLGKLQGIEQRDLSGRPILQRYLKVPYARPPVDELRWRHPQTLPDDFNFNTTSGEPGDYTKFGPVCPQPVYGHSAAQLANPKAAPPVVNVQSEDCLYLNIWVPAGNAPPGGWPVQFHIHGGWLQIGNAMQSNDHDPFDLLRDSTPRIIVAPTYRLNLFGFLAGDDLASLHEDSSPSNFGLWDQRMALEFVAKHIAHFNGNPDNISVGGLSAGANSTFFQLYYDSHLPASQRLIKRVYLWSNAVAIQPSNTRSTPLTTQFNELCTAHNINPHQPAKAKFDALRAIPSDALIASLAKLKAHTFRSSTDDAFIPSTFLHSLHSGHFTTVLAKHNISILLGEVSDEYNLYKLVNPPSTYAGLLTELANYYPPPVVAALLPHWKLPERNSTDAERWKIAFAEMTAAGQVHIPQRGLTHLLLQPPSNPGIVPLPPKNLYRYRIAWRAKSLDEWIQPDLGVCHGGDGPIWWCSGFRAGFTEQDKQITLGFLAAFGEFLQGAEPRWGKRDGAEERRFRVLGRDGVLKDDVEDELWDGYMTVWASIWEGQKGSVARL
jgi:carboxylesterase type B